MFAGMKTGTKVLAGFGIAIAVFLIVGGIGYFGLMRVYDTGDTIAEVRLPAVAALNQVLKGQMTAAAGLRMLANPRMTDPARRKAQYDLIEEGSEDIQGGIRQYESLPHTREEAASWKEARSVWDKWQSTFDGALALAREKDRLLAGGVKSDDAKIAVLDARTFATMTETATALTDAHHRLEEVSNMNARAAEEESDVADRAMAVTRVATISAILVGAMLMICLGVFIARSISKVLRNLVGETKRLTEAAVEGKLQTRGNPKLVSLEFRRIVEGVNATLDAVIGPLMVSAEYVDRISKGDIPPKITDTYHGDFNEIKNNLNQCIDAVGALVADANMLSQAAVGGELFTRADASKHQGDFRKIVEGVNATIGALVGHLDAVPAPALIVDKELTIRYMNKAGADVIGLPSEQICGTKCHHHFKTSDCNTERCATARAMRDARPITSETDAHPGKHHLEITYTGLPIKDREGRIVGAMEFVTDLTAIKQAGRVAAKVAEYQEGEVRKLAEVLAKMAQGDLTQDYVEGEADQDTASVAQNFATLGAALNSTIANLSAMIQQVTESANQFAEGSRVIAESSQSLAQGAQSQSSSVEEMTAAIEELARSVDVVKENATEANRVANEANSLAEEG
ncbi:MAG: PAS domain-containing protein, partial [Pirellulales bacterium]|nr:PAS domain-containing protein [Pirellulales bacterium]